MPASDDALFTRKSRYANFIGGEWVAPLEGGYFENISPVTDPGGRRQYATPTHRHRF